MEQDKITSSRRKFFLWSAAAICALVPFKFLTKHKIQSKDKAFMLTREGKLVEVEMEHIRKKGDRIGNSSIDDWIVSRKKI